MVYISEHATESRAAAAATTTSAAAQVTAGAVQPDTHSPRDASSYATSIMAASGIHFLTYACL
jgi:hypothetical protein